MTIKEFAETINFLRKNTNKNYTDEYYLYLTKDLGKGYADKNLTLRYTDDFDYVIPLSINFKKYSSGTTSFSFNHFGFYNNKYEPCRIIFTLNTQSNWELSKFEIDSCTSPTEFRLMLHLKEEKTKKTKEIEIYSDFDNIEETLDILKKELEKIE